MTKKFIRRDYKRYSKIGKNRKKLQKWRKPKGRDNKMRLKRKSYPQSPTVGHKSQKSKAGKVQNKIPIVIKNLNDIAKIKDNNILILSRRLGAKKKLEIIKQAQEKDLQILNVRGGNRR